MKKLVAAVLTGVLVAGTLSTGVYAKDDDKTITVAASATPHAEILEEAKPLLEKEGYDLEVTVFDDYVRPNEVVESGRPLGAAPLKLLLIFPCEGSPKGGVGGVIGGV